MAWFAFSCVSGHYVHSLSATALETQRPLNPMDAYPIKLRPMKAILILTYSAPAIGGFVVVGQMLKAYGSCVTLD